MSEESKNSVRRGDALRAVIYAPGMPFDAKSVATKSLGGSESAAYYLARELASRGHAVVVFTSKQDAECGDGVQYVWHGETSKERPLGVHFHHYACNTPHDLLVLQRLPFALHHQFAAKIVVWQLHDLALHRTAPVILGGTWQADAVTVVSEWHAKQVKEVWNINPEVLRVVPNGVDPALYVGDGPRDFAVNAEEHPPYGRFNDEVLVPRDKFLMLYQSRPERGLHNALELMDRAAKVGMPLHLLACAYDNPVAHMEPMYEAVYGRANAMPNVTLLGSLSKPELALLQKKCDLLLYPTEFEEVSCITAMEAMHAGLPLLTSAVGALPETCDGAGVALVPLKDGRANLDAFWAQLQEWFGLILPGQYPEALNDMRAEQIKAAGDRTWAAAADRLLEVFAEARAKRQASPDAILRHSVEHSDIAFAEWYLKKLDHDRVAAWGGKTEEVIAQMKASERGPIIEKTRDEIERLYSFAHSPEAYAAHYAKHQGAYYDGPGANAAGEDVTHTTRYRGVLQLLMERVNETPDRLLRVLDYGCAHGHYTVPLARTFPLANFTGMDISDRAIEAASGWAEREKLSNAVFVQGSQADLAYEKHVFDPRTNSTVPMRDSFGLFDVILAGEVLEHVWDYKALLDLFRGRLAPNGIIIVTTPLGRWEHSGTVPFRSAREHLHHFERGDIEDICRGHESQVLHAPASHDRSGFQLSSFVWSVRPREGLPLWSVDYERKLRVLATRQTVTAGIIAKDAESTLRRCVESLVDWVDEVVVAVDPDSTDGTRRVVANLALDFPNRPVRLIEGVSAVREGFAEARNRTLDAATGDWFLWIDADEELRNPGAMHRFLKPSMHNGYGWPQVHYSVDPEQVLTTDYPCRLFRVASGARFYGRVHEHPEVGVGNAIPWSLVRHEMKFLHHGYYDEETRQLRFRRNLPLLMRDCEEHPDDRPLNWFLKLRDIAQSIQFDARARGGLVPEQLEQAREGVRLMERIADLPQIKMVTDSLQYYSLCTGVLDQGFDGELTMKTRHPQAPDLAASFNFNGRFHSRAFYEKLVVKFTQESTKYYEDPHL